MRGIEPAGIPLREDVSFIEGRFSVGTTKSSSPGATDSYAPERRRHVGSGHNRGRLRRSRQTPVVETEIWCDARTLQGAYRRGNSYQSVLARLESADSFDTLRDWLTSNPQLNVMIRRENEYYAGQSQALTRLIRTIGFGIAGLMGIGAIFGGDSDELPGRGRAPENRDVACLGSTRFPYLCLYLGVARARRYRRSLGGLGATGVQRLSDVAMIFRRQHWHLLPLTPLLPDGSRLRSVMGLLGGLFPLPAYGCNPLACGAVMEPHSSKTNHFDKAHAVHFWSVQVRGPIFSVPFTWWLLALWAVSHFAARSV